MGKKITNDKKKSKIAFTINEKLLEILDEYLEKEEVAKRSRYIEKLIRDDMQKRGKDVNLDF